MGLTGYRSLSRPMKHAAKPAVAAADKWRTRFERGDPEAVKDKLFECFRLHEYYGLDDLVQQTKQPKAFLQELLREICDYSTADPYRNKFHLKPQFKFYAPAQ